MMFTHILPLVALSTAFVIPEEHVLSGVAIESHRPTDSIYDALPAKDDVVNAAESAFSKVLKVSTNAFDRAIEHAEEHTNHLIEKIEELAADAAPWQEPIFNSEDHGKHGHHGHHCPKPNQTVYQLISTCKYTTKLAELISEYDDLVTLLNGTAANYTIFAPIDSAFEKVPEHAPKPSKEDVKKFLQYHISSDFYPAGRVLVSHTIPSSLTGEHIGGELQRLSTQIGLRGLTVNFYSRIIAIDYFGTNGVIHGVDSLLIPPPKSMDIISFLPGEFSTLELALTKTGLIHALNDTSTHIGGTLFAPSNFAFQILGPRITAFLFSSYGLKYLKALLKYHVVADQTLYSDAYYKGKSVEMSSIPKGIFHIDLPTLLEDKSLSIDIGRFGRLISIKINGFSQVTIEDGIASDGVIQVVSNVLIPPKQIGGMQQQWQGETLTEEDLKERLEPFVERDDL